MEVGDVSKSFGKLEALCGISLTVQSGEIYGLLGPNGAGKTTLIRAIAGLVRPDSGRVTVLGAQLPNLSILAEIGYMTQAAALYPDLTVEENVRFFGAIHGAAADITETLEFVDLADRRRSVVSMLSGGMRQRLSLACALIHRLRLLLLDEPTVGVDPQLRVQLWDRFHTLARDGVAIVVSSHVMDEAERCDRLGLVRAGSILAEGSAAELCERSGVSRLEDAFLTLAKAAP